MTMDERPLMMELSEPDEAVVEDLSKLDGDLLLLGAGGKIGHSLALMAQRAIAQAGSRQQVIAVSRFRDPAARQPLQQDRIQTLASDLGQPDTLDKLPDAAAVIYLVGHKFGSQADPATTWHTNTHVPGLIAERYRHSRFVVFSSGNVYPMTDRTSGGPKENVEPQPIGEYAQSVLGRERVFEYFSRRNGTKVTTLRLNYANEPRCGVLVDLSKKILSGHPIDVTMGYVNLLWQGDCNRITLRCLDIATSPPRLLNVAGPQTLAVRDLALLLGQHLGKNPVFTGTESDTALLSDASFCWQRFGPPQMSIDEVVRRVADWTKAGGRTLDRSTHFQVRNGKY